jgi:hypothetical protein
MWQDATLAVGPAQSVDARTLHPLGQPTLLLEFVEMGSECDGSGESELCRSVGPGLIKELVDSSPAGGERTHKPFLALAPVSEILGQFRGGICDERPVARTEHVELPLAKALDPICVRPHCSWIRRDKDTSFAKNGVARERRGSGDVSEVIPGVAGSADRLEGTNRNAPNKQDIDLAARRRN